MTARTIPTRPTYAVTFADSATPLTFAPGERAALVQWIAERAHVLGGQAQVNAVAALVASGSLVAPHLGGEYGADRRAYAESLVVQAERTGYAEAFSWDVPAMVEAWEAPLTQGEADALAATEAMASGTLTAALFTAAARLGLAREDAHHAYTLAVPVAASVLGLTPVAVMAATRSGSALYGPNGLTVAEEAEAEALAVLDATEADAEPVTVAGATAEQRDAARTLAEHGQESSGSVGALTAALRSVLPAALVARAQADHAASLRGEAPTASGADADTLPASARRQAPPRGTGERSPRSLELAASPFPLGRL